MVKHEISTVERHNLAKRRARHQLCTPCQKENENALEWHHKKASRPAKTKKVYPKDTEAPLPRSASQSGCAHLWHVHSKGFITMGSSRSLVLSNSEELGVKTARAIINRYSDLRKREYSLKRGVQPKCGKRFDMRIEVGIGVGAWPDGDGLSRRLEQDVR